MFLFCQEVVSCSCLGHRGPDAQDHVILRLTEDTSALFCGFTLHFRGELTPQPLVDDRGNVLLWNGEIFDGVEVSTEQFSEPADLCGCWGRGCKDFCKFDSSIRCL